MQPDKPQRGGCGPLAIVLAVALVLGPPLYVLSIGPACWLVNRDYISMQAFKVYVHPARLATSNCRPLGVLLDRYVSLYLGA